MRAHWLAFVAAAGCGRVRFDVRVGADASADIASDAAPPHLVQVVAPGYVKQVSASATIAATEGDVVIAAVYWDETPDTVSFADTASYGWNSTLAQTIPACGGPTGNATGAQLYWSRVPASGSNTVTVTQTSGTQPIGVMLVEYANVQMLPEDSGAEPAPMASNTMSTLPVTTSGPAVVIAFFNDTIGTGTIAGAMPFTVEARDVGFPNLLEDAIVPSGTYTATATLPNAQVDACWIAFAAAFPAV